MPYLPQILETFKIIEICSGCINFHNDSRTEKYLTCNENKELYRDYITNCCKFYLTKRQSANNR